MVSPFQSRRCGRQNNYGFRLTVQKLSTAKIYRKQSIKCSKDLGWGVMKMVRLTPETVKAKRNKLRLERKQTSDSDEGNHSDQKDIIFKTPPLTHLPTGSNFLKSMKAIDLTSNQTITEGRTK